MPHIKRGNPRIGHDDTGYVPVGEPGFQRLRGDIPSVSSPSIWQKYITDPISSIAASDPAQFVWDRDPQSKFFPGLKHEWEKFVDFVPVVGTAHNWDEMGWGGRGFSIGMDALDIASAGSAKPLTTSLKLAKNPLRHLSKYQDVPQWFIRTGRPPGSGIQHGTGFKPQVVHGELGNFPIPPPEYTDLPVKPTKPWAIGDEPRGISTNWGRPGDYPMEKGVSSYMGKPFDIGDVPVSTGAFDVAEEVPSVYGNAGVSLIHPLVKPSGQTFRAEELTNPNLMVLRNPYEYVTPDVVTRSPMIDRGGENYLWNARNVMGYWMRGGLPDQMTGPIGKGTYRTLGKAVPELGADLEHLIDYIPTAEQLQRINYKDLAIASPGYSAQLFGHLDPYGRPIIPGGNLPFESFMNKVKQVTDPVSDFPVGSLPFTTVGRNRSRNW